MSRYTVKELGKSSNHVYTLGNSFNFNSITKVKFRHHIKKEELEQVTENLYRYFQYFGGSVDKVTTRYIKLTLPPFWRVYKSYDKLEKKTFITIYDANVLSRMTFSESFKDGLEVHISVRYFINWDNTNKKYVADIIKGSTKVRTIVGNGIAQYILGKNNADDKMEYDFFEMTVRDYLNEHYPNWMDAYAYWD